MSLRRCRAILPLPRADAMSTNAPSPTPSGDVDPLEAKLRRLRRLPVKSLRDEFTRLYGATTTSRNRDWLIRRCFYRVQELETREALTDAEVARAEAIAERTPIARTTAAKPPETGKPRVARAGVASRDPRLPEPGSVIERRHGDRVVQIVVRELGFEVEGAWYKSLSEVAKAVTGTRWNGFLWAGLTVRKTRSEA